jgi:hypothetical protein
MLTHGLKRPSVLFNLRASTLAVSMSGLSWMRIVLSIHALYFHTAKGLSVSRKDCVSISGVSNPAQSTLLSLRTHKGMRFPGDSYEI